MKMRNAELYLKEATVIDDFHPLAALARTSYSIKVGKTILLPLVQVRGKALVDYSSSE